MDRFSKAELKAEIEKNLMLLFSVEPEQASDDQFYKATSLMVRNILTEKQKNFSAYTHSNGNKEVYYLSMEFLMGRALGNNIINICTENRNILNDLQMFITNSSDTK